MKGFTKLRVKSSFTMSASEQTCLLASDRRCRNNGLSLIFAIVCIVDVFGVFPIVALPKAILDCGFLGPLVVIVVCGLQIYTAILLGKCWVMAEKINPQIHRKDRFPYSALTEATFGKNLSKCVEILLDITIFGAGVPNLILASQNIQLLGLRLSQNTFDVSYCYWIVIMGMLLCPILWLGSPKDMKYLCSISVVTVSSVFLLVFFCLLFSNPLDGPVVGIDGEEFNEERPLWQNLLSTYGIIAFQFDIHPCLLTIQVDMKEQNKLPKAIICGFAISISMAAISTIISTYKYGNLVQPSILETLPSSSALHLAAALVALQLCLTSAISNSALYQHMEDCLGISREFNIKRCILRTILSFLAIVLAESVPRFDLVMSLIGGTLTGPLMFILPPLLYIRMLSLYKSHEEKIQMETFTNIIYKTDETGRLERRCYIKQDAAVYESLNKLIPIKPGKSCGEKIQFIFCIIIAMLSMCMTFLTTYFNVTNAANYANFSKPCIYNISSTLLYL